MTETKRRFILPVTGNVAGNAVVQLAGGFVTQIVGFLAGITLARSLDVENYGSYALVQSYIGIFYAFSDLSMNNIIVRELTQRKAEREEIFFNAMLLKFFLGVATLAAYLLWTGLSPYDPAMKRLFLYASPIVLTNAFLTVSTVYRASLAMQYPTIFAFLGRSLFLVGVLAASWKGKPSLNAVVVWWAATQVLEMAANIAGATRWIKWRWRPDLALCRQLVKETVPMAIITLLVTGYLRLDPVFLSFLAGERAVGLYATAFALYQVALWVPNVLTTTYLPLMSERSVQGPESLKIGLAKLWKILWPMALVTVAVGAGGARYWVRLLYGASYESSIRPLEIMLMAAVPAFMGYPAVFALIVQKKQSLNAWVFFGAVIVSAACNFYWVPRYGASGAAMSAVVREFFVLGGTLWFLHRLVDLRGGPGRGFWLSGAAAVLWGLALFVLRDNMPAFIGILAGGAAVFTAVVLWSGYWTSEDLAWIKDSLGMNRRHG